MDVGRSDRRSGLSTYCFTCFFKARWHANGPLPSALAVLYRVQLYDAGHACIATKAHTTWGRSFQPSSQPPNLSHKLRISFSLPHHAHPSYPPNLPLPPLIPVLPPPLPSLPSPLPPPHSPPPRLQQWLWWWPRWHLQAMPGRILWHRAGGPGPLHCLQRHNAVHHPERQHQLQHVWRQSGGQRQPHWLR